MLKVRRAFSVGRKTYRQGQLVEDDHPAVKGREHLFVDAEQAVVEQATAAPGERRHVRRPTDFRVRDNQPQPASQPDQEEESEPASDLTCEDCGRTFKNAGGLSSHRRAKHG